MDDNTQPQDSQSQSSIFLPIYQPSLSDIGPTTRPATPQSTVNYDLSRESLDDNIQVESPRETDSGVASSAEMSDCTYSLPPSRGSVESSELGCPSPQTETPLPTLRSLLQPQQPQLSFIPPPPYGHHFYQPQHHHEPPIVGWRPALQHRMRVPSYQPTHHYNVPLSPSLNQSHQNISQPPPPVLPPELTRDEKNIAHLEHFFNSNPYPSRNEKDSIAEFLQITTNAVSSWFQKRRNKERKFRREANLPINEEDHYSGRLSSLRRRSSQDIAPYPKPPHTQLSQPLMRAPSYRSPAPIPVPVHNMSLQEPRIQRVTFPSTQWNSNSWPRRNPQNLTRMTEIPTTVLTQEPQHSTWQQNAHALRTPVLMMPELLPPDTDSE